MFASLTYHAPFGGAAATTSKTLFWSLPVEMADGSAIGTITNQTIYYDTTSRAGTGVAYANSVSVGDGTSTSYVVPGLSLGTTYYFVVRQVVGGVESADSPEVSIVT